MNKALACHCRPKEEIGHEIGTVLALDFKHKDGDSFMDRSVYGHLCTKYGSKWQLDGRYFDGSTYYIKVPHSASLNITDAITMLARIKSEAIISNYPKLAVKPSGSGWVSPYFYYCLGAGVSTGIRGVFAVISSGHQLSSKVLAIGQEYVIAGTYDREKARLFVDGGEVDTEPLTEYIPTSSEPLAIGVRSTTNRDEWFKGLIGKLSIYSFADYAPRILSRSIGG